MKQIFDWLREQIAEKAKISSTDEVSTLCWVADRLNEAEAKWEKDCCEWKQSLVYGYIKNPHTGKIYINELSMQNVYCNTCGKPIKILEVE